VTDDVLPKKQRLEEPNEGTPSTTSKKNIINTNLNGIIPYELWGKALDQLQTCSVKLIRTADVSVAESPTTSVIINIFLMVYST